MLLRGRQRTMHVVVLTIEAVNKYSRSGKSESVTKKYIFEYITEKNGL